MVVVATIDAALQHTLERIWVRREEPIQCLAEGEPIVDVILEQNPSLVILDLFLANPSGLEILRQIRAGGYVGQVVLLGGSSVQSLAPEAWRLGAIQVVGRPFHVNQILGALRVAREGRELDLAFQGHSERNRGIP